MGAKEWRRQRARISLEVPKPQVSCQERKAIDRDVSRALGDGTVAIGWMMGWLL